MATTAQNNLVGKKTDRIFYPIDASGSHDINQGDLVWYDTSVHYIKSLDSDAHGAYLAGVAQDTSYVQVYSTKEYAPQLGVYVGQLHALNTTAADTYYTGTPVYYGADAQTITAVSGTNILGYAIMRPGVANVAGGSGITVDVLVIPLYPTSAVA
jgi:hypothetical protein